jgi:hypothetical protein
MQPFTSIFSVFIWKRQFHKKYSASPSKREFEKINQRASFSGSRTTKCGSPPLEDVH